MMGRTGVLICLSGDIEVDIISALQASVHVEVRRRCGDLVDLSAAAEAGIGTAVVCEDCPDLTREDLSRWQRNNLVTVVLTSAQRANDVVDMGADVALVEHSGANVVNALVGLCQSSSAGNRSFSSPDSSWDVPKPNDKCDSTLFLSGDEDNCGKQRGSAEKPADPPELLSTPTANKPSDSDARDTAEDNEEHSSFRFPSRRHRRVLHNETSAKDKQESFCSVDSEASGVPVMTNTPMSTPGKIVLIRGAAGAPGRSTLALNLGHALGMAGVPTIVVDADMCAPSLAMMAGASLQWAGIAVACSMASRGRFDSAALDSLVHGIGGSASLMSGLSRADRWREVQVDDLLSVLEKARHEVAVVLIDTAAWTAEADGDDLYDDMQRSSILNALTEHADMCITVGGGNPLAVSRLVTLLEDVPVDGQFVVVNRVSSAITGPQPEKALRSILGTRCQLDQLLCIPETSDVGTALLAGRPIREMRSSSTCVKALDHIVSWVTDGQVPIPQRQRWWQRRWRRSECFVPR